MSEDRELKVFLAVLWAYIIGNVVFFVSLVSAERFSLPLPIWYMFLLLDAGFILVLFIPSPGRGVSRPVDLPPQEFKYPKWYPATLAEIVEGGIKAKSVEGVKPPGRAVTPVPVITLLLLLMLTIIFYPFRDDARRWRSGEIGKLKRVYEKARGEFEAIEKSVSDAGSDAAGLMKASGEKDVSHLNRLELFSSLDSMATLYSRRLRPIYRMGIQIFSIKGERYAWGGDPHYVDVRVPVREGVRFFTVRTTLYMLLVRVEDVPPLGRVIIDVPLEVNYRISNRFLRSVSLDEVLSKELGEEVDFNFYAGEHRGEERWFKDVDLPDTLRVISNPKEGVKVYGFLFSPKHEPLAKLSVLGKTYASHLKSLESRRSFLAGLIVLAIVLILSVWAYTLYGKRAISRQKRAVVLLRRSVLLVAILVLLRFILLKLSLPASVLEMGIFDPSLFADDFPFGLTKTAGDFLITSLFALILVFGVIKVFRTYYGGYLEMGLAGGKRVSISSVFWRAVLLCVVILTSIQLTSSIVTRVVLNSNPRLVGFDVDYFSLPFIVLHLALLFAVSSIFVAAVFILRLILLAHKGNFSDSLVASIIAIAAVAAFSGWSVLSFLIALGLMALAIRVFPLLRKEEVISVIFAAFFLIIVVTLAIYGFADERYEGLRKSRIEEKAQEFLSPEDNWIRVVLPDICKDISRDRSIEQKVRRRKESAAFEIWAGSPLSRLNLSCSFRVYDAAGDLISSFKVGLPFEIERKKFARGDSATQIWSSKNFGQQGANSGVGLSEKDLSLPAVKELESRTRYGVVYYYRGVAPVRDVFGRLVGTVEIEIPYFFENTELLAKAGPMAPEILHNIEKGALAPRVDEPEEILVARVEDGVVIDASNPLLPLGPLENSIGHVAEDWFALNLGSSRYFCIYRVEEDGNGYIVGFREVSFFERVLQWAAVVSIDLVLTLLSFVLLFSIQKLPLIRGVVPTVEPRGTIGFRQKILLSFLVVSIVPVVAIGIFSGRIIENRYREQAQREALSSVREAAEVLEHSLELEADAFIVSGIPEQGASGADVASDIPGLRISGADRSKKSGPVDAGFLLFDTDWGLKKSVGISGVGSEVLRSLREEREVEGVRLLLCCNAVYGGVLKPIYSGDSLTGRIFYARKLNDSYLKSTSNVLGKEINLYFKGILSATSEKELFVGGFLNKLLSSGIFRDLALGVRKESVSRESLGDYEYSVASIPLGTLGTREYAVLSVPLLYQPSSLIREYRRSAALVLGLLTLLFASTVTLGVFLARRIFNPIAALQEGTRRIMEGDLEFTLKPGAPDEIGELVSSFNLMTEALRKARRELTERQRYLSAVLENVGTGVIATDRAGRIITINPAGERILSVKQEELAGLRPEQVEAKELSPVLELLSASGGGKVHEREVDIRLEQRKLTLKAVVAELEAGGEKLGSVMVFDDLTELIRSKKLSAWVEMARQIAHEVKNPLTPIKLSAQFMRRAFEDRSDKFEDIFREGIETIIMQAEILRKIASEFSSFGKVVRVRPEVFEIESFLAEFISPYSAAEGISIAYRSLCGGIRAFADREALRKILVNLMENALEAMPQGGEISVECRPVGEMIEIRVLDTGSGLTGEVEQRLFEPYFSTKTNGTGLGLAISQSLAEEMGGKIILRNRRDTRGVEAVVMIPAHRGDRA